VSIALYVIAGAEALGTLLTIAAIGKPRKPVTGGTAVISVMVTAAVVVFLVLAARRLG
jgi:hypothetical protein